MGKPRFGERRPNLTRCHRWPSISRSGREIGLLYVSTHWSPRLLLTPFCARSQRGDWGDGGHSTLKHVPHSFALMLHVNLLQTETSRQYHITLGESCWFSSTFRRDLLRNVYAITKLITHSQKRVFVPRACLFVLLRTSFVVASKVGTLLPLYMRIRPSSLTTERRYSNNYNTENRCSPIVRIRFSVAF